MQLSQSESERAINPSERLLRSMLDSSTQGIYAVDLNINCIFCNAACLRLLGFQREQDLLGQDMHALVHHTRHNGSAYPVSQCPIYQALQACSATHIDRELLWRADGSSFEAEYWSYPIWEDGAVIGSVVTFWDISQRSRTEQNLTSDEERFRSLVRNSPLPTLIHAEDGEIIDVSQSLLDMTGYGRSELRTIEDWIKLTQVYSQETTQRNFGRENKSSRWQHEGECVVTTRAGDRREWDFSLASLPALPDGRKLFVSKAIDVTDRNSKARALRELERQSRQIIESLPQMVWTCQPDGSCDYMSPRWVEYTGIPLAQHLGSGWGQVIHPDDRDRAIAAWMNSVSNDQAYDIEYRVRRFDGDYRWFRAIARPLRSENGQIVKWFGTCTDIQERKLHIQEVNDLNASLQQRVDRRTRELQEALRNVESQARRMHVLNDAALAMQSAEGLEQLLQIVADQSRQLIEAHWSVTSFSSDQNFSQVITRVSLSDRYTALVKSDLSNVISKVHELVREKNGPIRMTRSQVESSLQRPGVSVLSDKAPLAHGCLAVPLIGSQGKNLGVILLADRHEGDFTDNDQISLIQLSRLAAAAIENARLFEETANANRELESFSYSVSHDLRAPLRSVDSFSRIILEDYGPKLDAEGHRLLNIVRDEAQRMGQLIDDLLQFCRTGRDLMEPTRVNMTALARHAYDDLPAKSRQHVQTFELPVLPDAYGDRAMLRQVWANLLSNAVKFTARNPGARVEVGSYAADDSQVYFVRDNGVGFDPRFTHKLFGVFQRLHATDEFEGTGVGQAIVQRVIQRHQGKVWAEGSLGAGAIFFFSLPKSME